MIICRWFTLFVVVFGGNWMSVCCKKKKELIQKSSLQLLEKESKTVDVNSCKSTHADSITKQRINDVVIKQRACVIKSLNSNPENGWAWSELGTLYTLKKENTRASTCFKQAAKLIGKVSSFIDTWHYIGPFVIGKIEVDGDPIEAYGGITVAARQRLNKKARYFSELVPGGETSWKTYRQKNADDFLRITPDVNLNDLVTSLGSLAITEWQGWVVGEFAVNSKDEDILVQCLGVHTIFIDDVAVVADVYRRDQFWWSVSLAPGIHTLYIRLRAKQTQVFKCSFKLAGANKFEVHSPTTLPDLVDGNVFGNVISIPVTNLQSTKWLRNIRVTMISQKQSQPAIELIHKESGFQTNIAPGQTLPVVIGFKHREDYKVKDCKETVLPLEVSSAGSGSQQTTVTLRCRKTAESFIFTFIDHDGSIQHAAAIRPLMDCPGAMCPVLLTLHGTGVGAQNQADSYKQMKDGNWIFGLENAWVLAPTRHGAHNWEGPGALTAMTSLQTLQQMTRDAPWIPNKADAYSVLFAGHSMGGHGAWHLATHYPDRALAVISLAGWIKKEEYGDSNVFFRHDLSTSHTDPAVKAILEACIAENDADRHVSNLKGIPVLARVGANDRTVHPYFVRRMVRLLKETKGNVTYSELPGKEHWWWDTWKTNDGGAVNDPQVNNFTKKAAKRFENRSPPFTGNSETCDGTSCPTRNRYSQYSMDTSNEDFTLSVVNPASSEGLFGVQVLRQRVPFRLSTIRITLRGERASLTTSNVEAFKISQGSNLSRHCRAETIQVDDQQLVLESEELNGDMAVCRNDRGLWLECDPAADRQRRVLSNLGPARRIAEDKFLIVTGTLDRTRSVDLRQQAVYIANLFYITSDAIASVIEDKQLSEEASKNYNLILIGGPKENSWSNHFLDKVPLRTTERGIELGECIFEAERTGALFLAPHQSNKLALVLLGSSLHGLKDVVQLAAPTIPPMTRSPFSNLIPDYVLTGPDFRSRGPGGYLCTGFWGNKWDFRLELSSCVC
ncbi:uncharacterized protein [Asterias amurensis]|uniref:uncharacterized protein n=1 Tax=Asterias amurensis TaxID=7602 RepID=UPI003AB58DEA